MEQERMSFQDRISRFNVNDFIEFGKIGKKREHQLIQLFSVFIRKFIDQDNFKEKFDELLIKQELKNISHLRANGKMITSLVNQKAISFLLDNNYFSYNTLDDDGNSLLFNAPIDLMKKLDLNNFDLNHKNKELLNVVFYQLIKYKKSSLAKIDFLLEKCPHVFNINDRDIYQRNLIDHVLLINKEEMSRDDKEFMIKNLVSRGCSISTIKEKNRLPKNWLDKYIVIEVEMEKKAIFKKLKDINLSMDEDIKKVIKRL